MRKPFKFILSVLLLLAFSLPAHAEISGLFQGDWGMSPEEIVALAGEPAESGPGDDQDGLYSIYMQYDRRILDEPAEVTYYFDQQERLMAVSVNLNFAGRNLSREQFEEVMEHLKTGVVDDPSAYSSWAETSTVALQEYDLFYDTQHWLNDETYIYLSGSAKNTKLADGASRFEASYIVLEFDSMKNAPAQRLQYIEELKAERNGEDQ